MQKYEKNLFYVTFLNQKNAIRGENPLSPLVYGLHMTKHSRHIIVAVTNDLVTDQRVDRTCNALADDGWQVTLVGRRLPHSPALAPRGYVTRRMRLFFRRSALFYAEYNIRLFLLLLVGRADVFFANDTDTLAACALAARVRRKALVFDAHELFPDVPELQGRRRVQAVWRWVERRSLPCVRCAFTVCQSVADEYRRRYGVEMAVVRNVPDQPPLAPRPRPAQTLARPASRLLLYQGAVNLGRGVHELVDVLGLLPECRLIVAGDGDLYVQERRYASALPWNDRVEFLGRVAPARLRQLAATADLGFCLLQDLGLNYRYSLPNRIADFANVAVPVLATDFPEIRRTLAEYHTGTLAEPLPATQRGESYEAYIARLANAIRSALRHWDTLPPNQFRSLFERAGEELSWQHEKHKLLQPLRALAED